MSHDASHPSALGYLVDLWVQIRSDADRPDADLHRRDRDWAKRNRWEAGETLEVLRRWLDALREQGATLPGQSVARVFGLLRGVLALLGVFSGWAAAAALLAYDGTRPVNVVHVLAVFVVTQVCLVLLLGWVLVPYAWMRRVPGATAVQSLLVWLSPGQLMRLAGYALPRHLRGSLAQAQAGNRLGSGPLGEVIKWAIVVSAQLFGVGFNVGALATSLYLVVFSDLAFAWSTTLQPDVVRIHRFTEVLSWPWAGLFPNAVPSEPLIRETLYYRQSGVAPETDPAHWGQWWPFLVASMVTYGLLPRCGLWVLANWRFGRAISRAFVGMPGVSVIWDRLTAQWVTTQAVGTESGAVTLEEGTPESGDPTRTTVARKLLVVDWGGVGLGDGEIRERLSARWDCEVTAVLAAGGRATLEADAAVIQEAAAGSEDHGLAVMVKGWEPPVLEALDFVRDLREAIGPRRLLIVCPVGLDPAGRPNSPSPPEMGRWERGVRARHDPALLLRGWPGGDEA